MKTKKICKPDYKALYEEECGIARVYIDKCDLLKQELRELRAIKATAEAFLGRKIEIFDDLNEIEF